MRVPSPLTEHHTANKLASTQLSGSFRAIMRMIQSLTYPITQPAISVSVRSLGVPRCFYAPWVAPLHDVPSVRSSRRPQRTEEFGTHDFPLPSPVTKYVGAHELEVVADRIDDPLAVSTIELCHREVNCIEHSADFRYRVVQRFVESRRDGAAYGHRDLFGRQPLTMHPKMIHGRVRRLRRVLERLRKFTERNRGCALRASNGLIH